MSQEEQSGKITGMHLFIRSDGNRIDHCEENSFYLYPQSERLYSGIMVDCYWGYCHSILFEFISENEIQITILNNKHEFLPDHFTLIPGTDYTDSID